MGRYFTIYIVTIGLGSWLKLRIGLGLELYLCGFLYLYSGNARAEMFPN